MHKGKSYIQDFNWRNRVKAIIDSVHIPNNSSLVVQSTQRKSNNISGGAWFYQLEQDESIYKMGI